MTTGISADRQHKVASGFFCRTWLPTIWRPSAKTLVLLARAFCWYIFPIAGNGTFLSRTLLDRCSSPAQCGRGGLTRQAQAGVHREGDRGPDCFVPVVSMRKAQAARQARSSSDCEVFQAQAAKTWRYAGSAAAKFLLESTKQQQQSGCSVCGSGG